MSQSRVIVIDMDERIASCAFCKSRDHCITGCNHIRLRATMSDLCNTVWNFGDDDFRVWASYLSRIQLRAIVAKLVLHSFSRLSKSDLIQIIKIYFSQFSARVLLPDSHYEYENTSPHITRAINFGRVAYIRKIISRDPNPEIRDLHLIDPRAEMEMFPDLWLNRYMYNTPLSQQFLLPTIVSTERYRLPSNVQYEYHPIDDIISPIDEFIQEQHIIFPLGLFTYCIPSDENNYYDCGICYDTIPNENRAHFDCGHVYCGKCAIQVYKTHHYSCAMCRKPTKTIAFESETQRKLCKTMVLSMDDQVREFNIA